jgi:hypothetical protein
VRHERNRLIYDGRSPTFREEPGGERRQQQARAPAIRKMVRQSPPRLSTSHPPARKLVPIPVDPCAIDGEARPIEAAGNSSAMSE